MIVKSWLNCLRGGEIIDTGIMGPKMPAGRSSDFVIKVHSYRQRVMEGSVESTAGGDSAVFTGLMSLTELIESWLDENNGPQATMALRNWDLSKLNKSSDNPEESETDFEQVISSKPLASFLLHIQFRQNAGWQGKLLWMNQKRSIAFRSFLELSTLLDRALLYSTGAEQAIPVSRPAHKWSQKESVS